MKNNIKLQILILILGILLISCNQNNVKQNESVSNFKELKGPYLGQKPPGMIAELFAPGIISNGLPVGHIACMPDGNEIYFSVVGSTTGIITICYTKLIDGNWITPEVAHFAQSRDYYFQEHHITPDGKKMMFSSTRPIEGETPKPGTGVENIWVMDRQGDGWGEPYDIGAPINTQMKEFQPSTTHDGTLYFTRYTEGDEQIFLYRSHLVNGKYTEPEKLAPEVNAGKLNYNGYIAPDEGYLVFNMSNANDSVEYYVSFRNEDDEWSKAIKFDERINLPNNKGWGMSLSSDSKYLFFKSKLLADVDELYSGPTTYQDILNTATSPANGNSNIYWVDAQIIDEFKPEHLK
jgi:hypothetical protein